jgi:hypothetical protein
MSNWPLLSDTLEISAAKRPASADIVPLAPAAVDLTVLLASWL